MSSHATPRRSTPSPTTITLGVLSLWAEPGGLITIKTSGGQLTFPRSYVETAWPHLVLPREGTEEWTCPQTRFDTGINVASSSSNPPFSSSARYFPTSQSPNHPRHPLDSLLNPTNASSSSQPADSPTPRRTKSPVPDLSALLGARDESIPPDAKLQYATGFNGIEYETGLWRVEGSTDVFLAVDGLRRVDSSVGEWGATLGSQAVERDILDDLQKLWGVAGSLPSLLKNNNWNVLAPTFLIALHAKLSSGCRAKEFRTLEKQLLKVKLMIRSGKETALKARGIRNLLSQQFGVVFPPAALRIEEYEAFATPAVVLSPYAVKVLDAYVRVVEDSLDRWKKVSLNETVRTFDRDVIRHVMTSKADRERLLEPKRSARDTTVTRQIGGAFGQASISADYVSEWDEIMDEVDVWDGIKPLPEAEDLAIGQEGAEGWGGFGGADGMHGTRSYEHGHMAHASPEDGELEDGEVEG